jgi:ribokinase
LAKQFDVAVMHDFFVDRLVQVGDFRAMLSALGKKAGSGGGGIHGVEQIQIKGGNAVNLAHALATLRKRTLLITHSDEQHRGLLLHPFRGLPAEVRIKRLPPGLTVALEGKVNVMLGHAGGAGEFPPSLLGEDDWSALRRSKVVCSVNWSANVHGTELLIALRERLGSKKTILLDPADLRDRADKFGRFLRLTQRRGLVDWYSLNEYEASATASLLGVRHEGPTRTCKRLAEELGARIDLHTEACSYSCDGGEVHRSEVTRVKPKRLTGAGDVWTAAAIHGRLAGMSEEARLRFANTAAKLYLTRNEPSPPTEAQVLEAN